MVTLDLLAVWPGLEPQVHLLPVVSKWRAATWTPVLTFCQAIALTSTSLKVELEVCECVRLCETQIGLLCLWAWTAEAAEFRKHLQCVLPSACLSFCFSARLCYGRFRCLNYLNGISKVVSAFSLPLLCILYYRAACGRQNDWGQIQQQVQISQSRSYESDSW